MALRGVTALLLSLAATACSADSMRLNGFMIDDPLVPARAIEKGGPPRDGIPAIHSPRFVSAASADFLDPDDRVLGLSLGDNARAYPLRILNRHEIVNDRVAGRRIAVTYCPLCGSGVAFLSSVGGQELTFGVSGLLYNSDVLLYDLETESLWSQISKTAINGPLKGSELTQLPLRHTAWADWRKRHPDTEVLSTKTGFPMIDYDRDPYAQYRNSNRLWFPVANDDKRLPRKSWVLGVAVDGAAKAYPFRELKSEDSTIRDRIGDVPVTIEFDDEHQTAVALDAHGEPLDAVQLFWFAWAAFHPDTTVWGCDERKSRC